MIKEEAGLARQDQMELMADETIEFEAIRDVDSLLALRDDWQRLWSVSNVSSQYPANFPAIWHAWARIWQPSGHRLHVLVGRVRGRVVLIWPAMILGDKIHGIWRVANWLGRNPIDYGDVLVEQGPKSCRRVEAAFRQIKATAGIDVVVLNAVRQDSVLVPTLQANCRRPLAGDSVPVIDLRRAADWQEFEAALPGDVRRERRRCARRLGEAGPVEFEFILSGAALDETVRWLAEQKNAWIRKRRFPDKDLLGQDAVDEISAVAQEASETKNVVVVRLLVNGKIIAANIAFRAGNNLYGDMATFDLAWAKYSPGSLLIGAMIEWAYQNGFETYDLGPGTDAQKMKWANDAVCLCEYYFAGSLFGQLYVWSRMLKHSKPIRSLLSLLGGSAS